MYLIGADNVVAEHQPNPIRDSRLIPPTSRANAPRNGRHVRRSPPRVAGRARACALPNARDGPDIGTRAQADHKRATQPIIPDNPRLTCTNDPTTIRLSRLNCPSLADALVERAPTLRDRSAAEMVWGHGDYCGGSESGNAERQYQIARLVI